MKVYDDGMNFDIFKKYQTYIENINYEIDMMGVKFTIRLITSNENFFKEVEKDLTEYDRYPDHIKEQIEAWRILNKLCEDE